MSVEKHAAAISTKARLERLRAERSVPRLEPHLTIGGFDQTEVKRRIEHLREMEIGRQETSLGAAQQKTERDFALASLKGRSRADFNHER